MNAITEWLMCDSCPAAAMNEARKDGMVLLFCGHHSIENRKELTAQGFAITSVVDDTILDSVEMEAAGVSGTPVFDEVKEMFDQEDWYSRGDDLV